MEGDKSQHIPASEKRRVVKSFDRVTDNVPNVLTKMTHGEGYVRGDRERDRERGEGVIWTVLHNWIVLHDVIYKIDMSMSVSTVSPCIFSN